MAMKQCLSSIVLLAMVLLSISTTNFAQPAAAPALQVPAVSPPLLPSLPPVPALPPTPPPPPPRHHADILKVLEDAHDFTVLGRLLKSTHVADEINSQLGDANGALTFFAPPDSAFARLKPGILNTLTNEKQVQFMQFHAIPTYLSTSQFQTVSNPLRTNAGGSDLGEFPLNVTTSGDTVSVSTGVNTATVGRTLYSDNELAVYEVDKVLLPMNIFASHKVAKAPAPEPEKPTKTPSKEPGSTSTSNAPSDETPTTTTTTPTTTTPQSTSSDANTINSSMVCGIVKIGFLALVASATL